MSKSKSAGTYKHVTPQLVDQVKAVLADTARHQYSVSGIYGAHNAVFEKKEQAQSCISCLKLRAENLAKWLTEYEGAQASDGASTSYVGRDGETFLNREAAEAAGQLRIDDGGGFPDNAGTLHPTSDEALASNDALVYLGKDGNSYLTRKQAEDAEQLREDDGGNVENLPAPAEGATRIEMAEGMPMDLIMDPDKPNKGKGAKWADGSKVQAGKYTTAGAGVISVQVTGVATITEDLN